MDGLTSFTEITKALLASWPLAVVIVVVVLRVPLVAFFKALGGRLQKFKGKASGVELEADFGQSVDKIEEVVAPKGTVIEHSKVEQIEFQEELVRLPPGYLVSQAWLKLENAIREAVNEDFAREDAKIPGAMRSKPSTQAYLTIAAAKGIIPESYVGAVQELRELRNRAAHDLNPNISVTDALRYINITNSLIEEIAAYRQNRSSM